ncbi:MAG: hypothetical protein JEZ11_06035 [Desulfobacterales bacterium]|nr:hypothetical protein [Desulfobacterales bacterium]
MPFVRMKGLPGKVYVPDIRREPGKHGCPDCYRCQQCSDDRCQVCVESKADRLGVNACGGKRAEGDNKAEGSAQYDMGKQ